MSDRRRKNLLALVERFDTQEAFGREVGIDPAGISRMLTGTQAIGNIRARKIEEALGLEQGWLDSNHFAHAQVWHEYAVAAFGQGYAPEEVPAVADDLLEAYLERWG